MPFFAEIAPKVIYKALPEKAQIELACKTGKQYALQSAYHLYNLLADPNVVRQLSQDELKLSKDRFQQYLNQSGQIRFGTRIALALWHFYYALTSKFNRFGKGFAQMANSSNLTPEEAARIKQSIQRAKQELQEALKTVPDDDFGREIQDRIRRKTGHRSEWVRLHQQKQAYQKLHAELTELGIERAKLEKQLERTVRKELKRLGVDYQSLSIEEPLGRRLIKLDPWLLEQLQMPTSQELYSDNPFFKYFSDYSQFSTQGKKIRELRNKVLESDAAYREKKELKKQLKEELNDHYKEIKHQEKIMTNADSGDDSQLSTREEVAASLLSSVMEGLINRFFG
jgi:hypothetical protein